MTDINDLRSFLAVYESDDNEWWRADCGLHQNLFETAVEQWRVARAEVERLQARVEQLQDGNAFLAAKVGGLQAALQELFDIFIEGGYAEDEDLPLVERIHALLADDNAPTPPETGT